jgi:hypothetical protein
MTVAGDDRSAMTVMRRGSGVCRWVWCIAVFTFAFAAPRAPAQSDPLESAVKATYLYKLPEFVSWPPGSIPSDNFMLCVVGHDPITDLLEQAVQGQTVQDRRVMLQRYNAIDANPGCQLMYVAGSAIPSVATVLSVVRGMPVLTVTDGQTEPGAMGMINFILVQGHVRFEINRNAAVASRLGISSKLLTLAVRTLQ